MAYKNKEDRNIKREYDLEQKRAGAHEARMERQRARRALDKKGVDRTGMLPMSKHCPKVALIRMGCGLNPHRRTGHLRETLTVL